MKNKKLSIGLLIALVGFPQISETIYTPALPNVAIGLLTSAYMVEATLAIYFLGFAMGVLLWGTISDYCGRRKAMLSGLIIYGFATYKCANVEIVEALLTWRFFQAFGASVGSVITQTILRDSFDGNERTKLFSILSGALAFSPAIGPLMGGFISEYLGWRANFWVLVLLSIFLFIWSFIILPETKPKNDVKTSNSHIFHLILLMLSSRILWGHIFLISATNGILFGFYQEAPFLFIEQAGLSPKVYGCFGLLIAASTILSSKISYQQSNRTSYQTTIQQGALCILLGGSFFTFTVMNVMEFNAYVLSFILMQLFLIFFGIGLIIPNSLSHALKPYGRAAGTAGSIFGGCYYLLIAACTWIMSSLHNGTALPLPLYMLALGIVALTASQMIRSSKTEVEEVRNFS